jgi:hypothetical protein
MNTYPFTPVDYIFTGLGSQPVTFAFSYDHILDPDALKKGLHAVLDLFPILQSTLTKTAENEYTYQICPEGLTFDVLESSTPFRDRTSVWDYVSPVDTMPGHPLTKITLTQTPEGSILAVSISHALVDGFSYFHFFSSWARLCRGDRMLPPSLERQGLVPTLEPSAEAVTPQKFYNDCGLYYREVRTAVTSGQRREERFFISKESIKSDLEEAKKEFPHVQFSENDVITARLWRQYLPVWYPGKDNPMTYVTCPLDFRRIFRKIAKNYFGCALCFASGSMAFEQLATASLGQAALIINRSIHAVNEDHISRALQTLDDLRNQKGLAAFEHIHLKHPEHGIIVTNLTRLPVRDLDFGSGAPTDFTIHADVRGSAAILPAENGVEIIVLNPEE